MHQRKNVLAIALTVMLATLIPSGVNLQASGGSPDRDVNRDVKIVEGGNVRIVTVDEDGNEHEQVYGLFGGSGAFLGVRLEHESGSRGGARIERIIEGTPADDAGLRDGDVIVSIDGHKIDNAAELSRRIDDFEPGDRIDVEIDRGGRARTLSVRLGERKGPSGSFDFSGFERFGERMGELGERLGRGFAFEFDGDGDGDGDFDSEQFEEQMRELEERLGHGFAFEFDGDEGFDSEQFEERMRELGERLGDLKLDIHPNFGRRHLSFGGGRPKLGVQLVATTPELREHLGGSEDAGVLVSKVLAGMPAEAAGVRVGDLIVAVGDEAVRSAGDLVEALSDRSGETIELEVIRDGRTLRLDVDLEDIEPAGDRA